MPVLFLLFVVVLVVALLIRVILFVLLQQIVQWTLLVRDLVELKVRPLELVLP